MARGPVLSAVVLGASLSGIAWWAWAVRDPKVDAPSPAKHVSPASPDAGEIRVETETAPAPPAPDRDRLLADAKSEEAALRLESGKQIGRALDRGNDAELLRSLHALAQRDPSLEVRGAALGELVFRNDRPSFEILLEAARATSQPPELRLRAIELLERAARADYGLFLANHGCPGRESDRIAAQRRERARAALAAADQGTLDPGLRAALQKALGKFN
jgi:hypothetical protein